MCEEERKFVIRVSQQEYERFQEALKDQAKKMTSAFKELKEIFKIGIAAPQDIRKAYMIDEAENSKIT